MKLENEFTVPAPVERAWEIMLDLERVAPCLPGATIDGVDGDEHAGTMTIKIGPITARYRGTVRIEAADADAHRAVMRAKASDQRGQGTASATITATMETVPGGTRVHVETDLKVTGPAAQFGRGVMQEVSAKLMGRFAECLAAEMAQGAQAGLSGPAPTAQPVATGTAGIVLPPGPAGDAAEAAARARAGAANGPRPRPTEDVLDLGAVSRNAVLKRTAPALAVLAVLVLVRVIRGRR
jgi:carbon monoxide dehydrogenase subunit G